MGSLPTDRATTGQGGVSARGNIGARLRALEAEIQRLRSSPEVTRRGDFTGARLAPADFTAADVSTAVVDQDGTTVSAAIAEAAQSGGDATPTTPPDSSPTPTVYASSGAMSVVVPAVDDSRTRLRLYLAAKPASGDPAADDSTLFTDDAKGVVVTFEQSPGGMPLDPAMTYSVAVQAYNVAGDGTVLAAAPSPWVDGSPAPISPLLIAQTAIVQALYGTTIEAVDLRGVTITANELISQGVLRIYGGADSTLSGPLIAAQGVTTPASAPTVTLDWATTAMSGSGSLMRSLCDDGTRWLTIRAGLDTDNADKMIVYGIDKTSGAVTTYETGFSTFGDDKTPLGICKVASTYYILYRTGSGTASRVFIEGFTYANSAFTYVAGSKFEAAFSSWDGRPIAFSATPEGRLAIVGYESASSEYRLSVDVFNANGGFSTSYALGSYTSNYENLYSFYVGQADFSEQNFVIQSSASLRMFTVSGRTEMTSTYTWPLNNIATTRGLTYTGSGWFSMDYSARTVSQYTANKSGTTSYAYTWRDDDTTGAGTAETLRSPVKTVTVRRQRVNVTLPSAPPDDGTADGANTATIYAGPSGGTLRAQTDLTETQAKTLGPFRYTTAPTTSGRVTPTSSGFEGRPGGVGRYQSSAADSAGPLWGGYGDGTWRAEPTQIGLAASSAQSISNNAWALVATDTTSFARGAWNATSGGVTIPTTGVYTIEAFFTWAINTSGRRIVRVEQYTNEALGSGIGHANSEVAAATGFTVQTAINQGVLLTAGTTLRFIAYQTSGGNLASSNAPGSGGVLPRMTIRKIGSS